MSQTLEQVAQTLKDSQSKVQLIYAFNGTGKTRLSKEFKNLINGNDEYQEDSEEQNRKILYYNAFTEDLFYWDNDLENDFEPILKIYPNRFTNWLLGEQGQGENIIRNFQKYTSDKLTPIFKEESLVVIEKGKTITKKIYPEIKFSLERGDDTQSGNIKISKGEESSFIWNVFYSLFELVIEELNIPDPTDRNTNQFNDLEYIFIDDPVSSLDENNLIELAVGLARLVKSSESDLKFIITTHNPLFYNVLHNEFKKAKKHILSKEEDGTFELKTQANDSPFSYHLYLKSEIETAIKNGELHKYHFNFLRNILEKTSTFLGRGKWSDLLPKMEDKTVNPYETRIINMSSHSNHSVDEVYKVNDADKRVLIKLVDKINEIYNIELTNKEVEK